MILLKTKIIKTKLPSVKMEKIQQKLTLLMACALCLLAQQVVNGQTAFLDCTEKLEPMLDDGSALTYIKEVHDSKKFKFSSSCLEILLKKNF